MLAPTNRISVILESTMVGPLWARAEYSKLFPNILYDLQAIDLIEKVKKQHPESEREFRAMEGFIDEFYGLTFLIRARLFEDAIKEFISRNPEATVVNIGCGLDTTYTRIDNGQITWYDLDLPKAIDYRRRWLPETARNKYIAQSVFDPSWIRQVDFSEKRGLFCFAGGLFHYFSESKVASLFQALAEAFPRSELLFDMVSKLGIRILKRRFKSYGIESPDIKFGLRNPRIQIPSWTKKAKVLKWFPMFSRIPLNPYWKWKTRIMMRLSDWFGVVTFIHVKFQSSYNG
ncbi:MAG: class I SAM-dependent methyltransferase [Candidatus Hodarchaeota archaeon]